MATPPGYSLLPCNAAGSGIFYHFPCFICQLLNKLPGGDLSSWMFYLDTQRPVPHVLVAVGKMGKIPQASLGTLDSMHSQKNQM
jgi:hypothetical protein